MKINRSNYEIYILDYKEGNLSYDVKGDFDYFLEKNPDIKAEINEYEEIALSPPHSPFTSKYLLKKDNERDIIGLSKFEQLSISYLENDIKPDELKELEELSANSAHKQNEFQIIQKLKLTPDYSVNFQFKNGLKHKYAVARINALYYVAGIAASIVLMLGATMFYYSTNLNIKGQAISYQLQIIENEIRAAQLNKPGVSSVQRNEITNTLVIQELPVADSITSISIKSRPYVVIENRNKKKIEIENFTNYKSPAIVNNDDDYFTLMGFFNKQFKEKILRQPVTEKATFVSVGKAFTRGLSKIFRKEIKLDQKVMEDGSKFYAFKAGSFEIYTNKPSKKADQSLDEKSEDKSN